MDEDATKNFAQRPGIHIIGNEAKYNQFLCIEASLL